MITVYQPQVERWADNNLSGRAAVSVLAPGAKEPAIGVIELSARTEIDKSSDLVTLCALRITKTSFPGASAEQEVREVRRHAARRRDQGPLAGVRPGAAGQPRRGAGALKQKAVPVKNEPPQILFRTAPSHAGAGRRRAGAARGEGRGSLWRVINTTALLLLQDASTKT